MSPFNDSGETNFSLAAQLHAADDSGEIHVAAALSGAEQGALHLDCAGENGRAGVSYAKPAVGMSVKSETCFGVTTRELRDRFGDFFGTGTAGGVADNDAAHVLADALLGELVEIIEAVPAEIGIARSAVFPASAVGVHGVLEIDDDLEAVVAAGSRWSPTPCAGFLRAWFRETW